MVTAMGTNSQQQLKQLNWALIVALGALALVRPLASIIENQTGVDGGPIVPIGLTIGISLIWIAVVGLSRTPQPLLTLVCVALTYAVLSIVVSGVSSPILDGELQGPLANPIAIVPVLLTNAVWGLLTGALALLVQRLRQPREPE